MQWIMGERYMIKRILMLAMMLLYTLLPVGEGAFDLNGRKGAFAMDGIDAFVLINREDAVNCIRDNFMAHENDFTLIMNKNTLMDLLQDVDLLYAAALLDDAATSRDSDYLKANVISWEAKWHMDKMDLARLTISADYRTTLKQEELLEKELASAIEFIDMKNATDYDKVKAIHDYIIDMVSYDQSLSKYSAYDALIDKSAVCLGYAAAAYRMFTDAGIESRIIAGLAGDEEHVWNIVKVDGEWYNIDLTWDDPILDNGQDMVSYDFFLKNENDFYDQVRTDEYNTDDFLYNYKIAETSYTMK